MAEGKTEQKTDAPKPSRKLASAAESGDPAVHQLLAQRQTAQMNEDEDQEREVSKKLADLGYE